MQNFNDMWNIVLNSCKEMVSDVSYNTWFSIIEPIEFNGSEATLRVAAEIQRDVIEQNYSEMIKNVFKNNFGLDVTLKIICGEDEKQDKVPSVPGSEYTFDNFVVGPSNRFAHAASFAVADNEDIVYNPLFIYGNSGVGKTHLALAIFNHIKKRFPNKTLLFMRAEEFGNDLILSLRDNMMEQFRNKYRTVDVLLLDDIHFIAGKTSMEEEFFNTFNALHQNNKQIIVTSDRPPKEIKSLQDRIKSRLEDGLLCDIQPPEFETRVAIIQRKAQLIGLDLDNDTAFFIAEQIKQNIRQLEGVVKKLQALTILDNRVLNKSMVQSVVNNVRVDSQSQIITVDRIIEEVARTYSISVDDILSKKRDADISKARKVSMYIIKEITNKTLEQIGEPFNKNHSTVHYSIENIEEMMKHEPHEKEIIDDIIKNLQA